MKITPHNKPNPKTVVAFAIAILADAIELPLNLLFCAAWLAVPVELTIVLIDLMTMTLLTWLLGFHWPLVAALGIEVIPGADVIPTWTGCVAYILWQRKKAISQSNQTKHAASEIIIDIPHS